MGDVLTVRSLQKIRKVPLFLPVQFSLSAGEGLGIYGHNGCGKTTLLDILAGLQKADSGAFQLNARIGYVMQTDGFQDALSCRDNLLVEAALCGLKGSAAKARVDLCAAQCDLLSFWNKRLSKCSAGMRARLSLAAALLPDPGLLLLDEAFSALDQQTYDTVKLLLQEKKRAGLAILLVSHNRDDFSGLCERVLSLPYSEVTPLTMPEGAPV
ncbi:MAG: ATP-binding cassette domain-containing protein [Clostridiales Family XIII bacterium]|jgi:ABC-type multidrug transport system ATPase subunit|nr:ATP-binding cassette domain-containing protein [Clostridiales Family XIII bacterium]